MNRQFSISALTLFALAAISCGPTSYEEVYEFRELAEITTFSVPDSVSAQNIPVSISAVLGRTTASRFREIVWERVDSLFSIAVFATRTERYGEQYALKVILLDTTLVLTTSPPRTGLHHFNIVSSTGVTLKDSAQLY